MRQFFAIAIFALLLSGCITAAREREVYGAIGSIGVLQSDATCLAARAGHALAICQLRSLECAARAMDQPVREMPVGQVIDTISDHVDAQTPGLVVRLAIACRRSGQPREKAS